MSNNKSEFSLLPEQLRGVVLFYTGQSGAGKSTGSLLDPYGTVFIDADHMKSREMARKKPHMKYEPVNGDDRTDPARTGEMFLAAINAIDKSKTTVVVLDNLYEIEEGLHAFVMKNPIEVAKMTNKKSSHITGRQWGQNTLAHERLLKSVVDELLAANITVVIIAHMKDKFQVKGQLEIRGRNWVYEAASFVGIMIRTGAAPDVLVFKSAFNHHIEVDPMSLSPDQIAKYRRGELESSVVYPQVPRRIPGFTPTKLFAYLARTPEEIESTPYAPDEILDEFEMAPYLEILTKEQRANIDKIMASEEEERKRANEYDDNLREAMRVELDERIIELADMDMTELLPLLKKEFGLFASEISPPYIIKVRNR